MNIPLTPLPTIFFSRSKFQRLHNENVTIIDRHGADVTHLFRIQALGFKHSIGGGFAKATLVFLRKDWIVSQPDEVEEVSIVSPDGYNLMESLEINTMQQNYPRNGKPEIEITFDAEWLDEPSRT